MRSIERKLLAILAVSCILLCYGFGLASVASVDVDSNGSLDMSGAIEVGDPFGVCHGGNVALMQEIGINLTRNDITWTGIEPTDDDWHWTGWDNHVASLQANDLRVLPILDYSNPAVQEDHASFNTIYSEHDIQEWLEYVNNCVEKYYTSNNNYVDTWEIWNEPNLGDVSWMDGGFWTGTDEQFFELQKRTAANLTANPLLSDLKIMSGGISGHSPEYLSAMFDYGAMEDIDILAFHPYSGSSYDSLDVKINEVKEVADKYGFDGELWITEVGMATGFDPSAQSYKKEYKDSLDLQATLVPKVYAISLAMGIEHVVWYCLSDGNNWTWGEHNFGLVYDDDNVYKPADYANDKLKPSGYAYKAIAHNLKHTTYVPNGVQVSPPSLSGSWLRTFYFLKENGDVVLICWNAAQTSVDVEIPLPAGTNVQVYQAPSYKDVDGANYTTNAGSNTLSVTFDFDPKVLVIDLPASIDPMSIQMELTYNFQDITLIIIVPGLVAACIVMYIVRSGIFKRNGKRAVP